MSNEVQEDYLIETPKPWPPIAERPAWEAKLRTELGRRLSFAEALITVKFQGAGFTPTQAAKFYER